MAPFVIQALRELGNVVNEAQLTHYLEDPWITGIPAVIDKYLHGECDQLAKVLSSLTGFPMYAVFEQRLITSKEAMRVGDGLVHAFVSEDNCATVIDAKGKRAFCCILEEYDLSSCTQAFPFKGL